MGEITLYDGRKVDAELTVDNASDKNPYHQALEYAGVKVVAFESFGDYQGTWVAVVLLDGRYGVISDYFGSCTHCDAFQGAFGWETSPTAANMAEFGRDYFEKLQTFDEAIKQAEKNLDWDLEAKALVDFLKKYQHRLE